MTPPYNLYLAQRRMRPSSWRLSIFIPGLRVFPERSPRTSAETVVFRTPTSIFAYQSGTVLVSWLNLIAILPFSRVYDTQYNNFIPGLRVFPERSPRTSAETVVFRTPTSIFAYQSGTVLVSWLNLIAILPFSRVYDKQFSSRSLKQIPRAKHANLSHTNAWRLHAIFQL